MIFCMFDLLTSFILTLSFVAKEFSAIKLRDISLVTKQGRSKLNAAEI